MTVNCDICGNTMDREGCYHAACLRRLFGAPALPAVELSYGEVLGKAREMAGKLSISGVQPKLSMARRAGRLVPVTEGGQFILKPQTEVFPLLPQNENLCMSIAGQMGIAVPPHGLIELRDGSPAYVVRRFDRTDDGAKLRCEDFAQILGASDKYSGSIEQIGRRIKELSNVPGLDVQLFFERVLLNFLLGNGDAHMKNFSMLEADGGGLRLAPAYDIVCSKVVLPAELDCALTLNGKNNKVKRADFEMAANTLGIPGKALGSILERFQQGQAIVLAQVEASRLPADVRKKMRVIVEERYGRMFGR